MRDTKNSHDWGGQYRHLKSFVNQITLKFRKISRADGTFLGTVALGFVVLVWSTYDGQSAPSVDARQLSRAVSTASILAVEPTQPIAQHVDQRVAEGLDRRRHKG
jgi:hypothetical protein